MRKIITVILGLLLIFSASATVIAQEGQPARLSLSTLEIESFPQISLTFEAYTPDGAFISGLTLERVTVVEDGLLRPVSDLTEQINPVQWVVAVNPGTPLAFQDANLVSRYSRVQQTLQDWAVTHPTDIPDDMSLVSATGAIYSHGSVQDWLMAFSSAEIDLRNTPPTLQTLAFALDLAQDAPVRPNMKRAILFITPHMEQDFLGSLDSLLARALESEISIFVWMIDSDAYFDHSSATTFQNLALQTGGHFYKFSGSNTAPSLPTPEEFLNDLRHSYALTYRSALNTPGEHTLAVQIEQDGGRAISPPQPFLLNIQPPNPILVSPPAQITRQAPPEDKYNLTALAPREQPLEMLVDFPDGIQRSIVRTALYVDGQLVSENTSEPFNTFAWDLYTYLESSEHTLQVEAEDELGLSRISLGVPVQVTVIQPPRGLQALLDQYSQYLAGGAALLAGVILLIILTSRNRRRLTLSNRRKDRSRDDDPVTQPVEIRMEGNKSTTLFPWTRRSKLLDAHAYLVRLNQDGEPVTGKPIPLNVRELTLGNDPVQSLHVLDDPSIAPLHARIRQTDEGEFIISDQDTVAGTWVNFEPITRDGQKLNHGDVIHFGKLNYRFTLRKAPKQAEPQITYFNRDG